MPGEHLTSSPISRASGLSPKCRKATFGLIRRESRARQHGRVSPAASRRYGRFHYPTLSGDTRTAKVRIVMPIPISPCARRCCQRRDRGAGRRAPVLAVPDSAVTIAARGKVVLIEKGGAFCPRAVKLGARGGGFVEVSMASARASAVVTGANFLIDAESNLKAASRFFSASHPAQEVEVIAASSMRGAARDAGGAGDGCS